ncbi:unnamed protein product [Sphagnum balticum]
MGASGVPHKDANSNNNNTTTVNTHKWQEVYAMLCSRTLYILLRPPSMPSIMIEAGSDSAIRSVINVRVDTVIDRVDLRRSLVDIDYSSRDGSLKPIPICTGSRPYTFRIVTQATSSNIDVA